MTNPKPKHRKKTFPQKQDPPVQKTVAINALNNFLANQSSVGRIRKVFHNQSSFEREFASEVLWLSEGVL